MFVAWRDLAFAKGRFALLGAVVALITLLVGFLSGLTVGLGEQSISSIQNLNAQQFVVSPPGSDGTLSFADSAISKAQAGKWESAAGVSAIPLGIGQGQANRGDSKEAVAVFGSNPGTMANTPANNGEIVLSETSAIQMNNASAGQTIMFAGKTYTVTGVVPDQWYSHLPVVWMTLADWQSYSETIGQIDPYATVLVVDEAGDYEAGDKAAVTQSVGGFATYMAIGSFSSEIGSLLMILSMLVVISAVVIGAFFTVWIMQRTPDIAVLKALGSSTKALLVDALGQALIILVIGVGIGLLITTGLGLLLIETAGSAVPFSLSIWTTVAPALIFIVTGLLGASFALRSVAKAAPLAALGANR
ncbi:MAG: ABC transporter permease [Actinobacteria bacterium]|nr:ABC transporter permease [Actinomycetota bacterium]